MLTGPGATRHRATGLKHRRFAGLRTAGSQFASFLYRRLGGAPQTLAHGVYLPPGDADFSQRWRLIKRLFTQRIPKDETLSAVRLGRGECGISQRRFREHLIRNDADFTRHVDYMPVNPVKHGLVARAAERPHAMFH